MLWFVPRCGAESGNGDWLASKAEWAADLLGHEGCGRCSGGVCSVGFWFGGCWFFWLALWVGSEWWTAAPPGGCASGMDDANAGPHVTACFCVSFGWADGFPTSEARVAVLTVCTVFSGGPARPLLHAWARTP